MQDRVVGVPPSQPKKEQHPHGCCSFFAYEIRTPDHLRAAVRVGQDRAAPNKHSHSHFRAIRWLQVPPPQPYSEAKKDIMASNPRNREISGVFLAFARFFATMRFADTECRKKDIISKKRLPAGCRTAFACGESAVPIFKGRKCGLSRSESFLQHLLPFFRIFIC